MRPPTMSKVVSYSAAFEFGLLQSTLTCPLRLQMLLLQGNDGAILFDIQSIRELNFNSNHSRPTTGVAACSAPTWSLLPKYAAF